MKTCILVVIPLVLSVVLASAQTARGTRTADETALPVSVRVATRVALDSLIRDEDTDGDLKITIDDPHIPHTTRGDKRFSIPALDHGLHEVVGTYYLSNLLQELTLGEQAGHDTMALRGDRIFEPPVERISRSIREIYWSGLTRRIDEEGLQAILRDEKTTTVDGLRYVYVPPSDTLAASYFSSIAARHPDWKMKVVILPDSITPSYVRGLDGHHGILSLSLLRNPDGTVRGEPFVVPGGRFNEMYGWDSYFIVLGLLHDDMVDLAKSMVDNHVYEIMHYGAILNANRTYYLTRSQPPFLSSMARAVYARLPHNDVSRAWRRKVLFAAIREYKGVWMNDRRLTATGLSRYFDSGSGVPPEVEPGHFNAVFAAFAKKYGMPADSFETAYRSGRISAPDLDRYFVNDRSMRESGHDTSYRLEDRSADLVTVDLNSLLYRIETDIAALIRKEFGGSVRFADGSVERSGSWLGRAAQRKQLINKYLWDAKDRMFFDYDTRLGHRTGYVSATTFYPMWAELASADQAASLVKYALPMLEMPGGIAGSSEESRGPISKERPPRQWDYPYGWSPHQMLVWQALLNYGYRNIAERLAYRWLFTITLNAVNYNGTVPEKFDVVRRTHQVFAEYGNVGTQFSYITREGFGWTNASYQIGRTLLTTQRGHILDELVPPEWIFR